MQNMSFVFPFKDIYNDMLSGIYVGQVVKVRKLTP